MEQLSAIHTRAVAPCDNRIRTPTDSVPLTETTTSGPTLTASVEGFESAAISWTATIPSMAMGRIWFAIDRLNRKLYGPLRTLRVTRSKCPAPYQDFGTLHKNRSTMPRHFRGSIRSPATRPEPSILDAECGGNKCRRKQ